MGGVLVASLFGLGACAPGAPEEAAAPAPAPDDGAAPSAAELAHELVLIDTHIDVPYRLVEDPGVDISQRTEGGDFDHPRAVAGGLDVAFMSVYIPAKYQETGGAKELADELVDMVEGFATSWPEKFRIVRSAEEAELRTPGIVGLALGMENGEPIEGDLANLRHYHDRGIRYVTLTHSENNHISDSSYSTERTWEGLSPFGREVVAEMNRLGMMIDISHLSDAAAEQVLELSEQPVIASHSSLREFTPGFERNLSEDLLVKLAANGGVLQINFGSGFLTEESNKAGLATWAAMDAYAEENDLDSDAPELEEFVRRYRQENPMPLADLNDVLDHIDRAVAVAGIDHVGLGSDFDGVGPSLPDGLKDVSQYPNLIQGLLDRGYSKDEIAKVCGGNLLRVWRAVEAGAGT